MKKILLILIFVTSCNSDKSVQPTVCIDLIRYYEPPKRNMNQPSVAITIKVNDSSVCKRLERGELKHLIIYSIKKEDRNRFFYSNWDSPIRDGNNFSFVIWINYFMSNVTYMKNHKKREWESDEVLKALNGDIGLVFDKDTILAKSCLDKKMIIQMINE